MRVSPYLFASVALWLGACSGVDPSTEVGGGGFGAFPGGGNDAGAAVTAGGGTGASTGSGSVPGAPPPSTSTGASSSGGDAVGCEAHVAMGTRTTPDMLIVLDRSSSMNPGNNDNATDRWGGSRTALIEVTDSFDDKIRFGLMTFPGVGAGGSRTGGDAQQCAPGNLDVPVGLQTGPAIASTLMMMNAEGRTPTAAALQAALPIIAGGAPAPDQTIPPKYVLLVTDGDPNCGSDGGGRGGGGRDNVARMQTIEAIQALAGANVKTYVVGYQTAGTDFVDQLDRMAAAGGTGETMHRSVASGADLNMTLSQIAANVISCSYQLTMKVSDPRNVLVRVNGQGRNINDMADGFRLESDKRTITLLGKACEEVQQGAAFAVQVTCEPVPLF